MTKYQSCQQVLLYLVLAFVVGCTPSATEKSNPPAPTEGIIVNEKQLEGESEGANARERYENLIHRTTDSVDWRYVNEQNFLRHFEEKQQRKKTVSDRSTESFAGGLVIGEWTERGSANQSGSLLSMDYEADENKIYGISDGGSVYRGNLNGTGWEVLNDDIQFDGRILQVMPNGNGKRILSAIGKQVWYSDDEGVTWTQSTGLNYYDDYGSAQQLIALNDGNSVYFMAYTWNQSPWGSQNYLFYSSNKGASFTKIQGFGHNGNYWAARNYTRMWSPYNSNELYVVHTGTSRGTYSVAGSTITLLNSAPATLSSREVRVSGYKNGSTFNLYALVSFDSLYRSTNSGLTWSMVGSPLPEEAWSVGIHASPFEANRIYFGEVDCYRSNNQGSSWSLVNNWWEYYGNINDLHADMMEIKSFEKTDGTKFLLVANHGGLHVSYNNLSSTTNIATSGLNISQYYDVRTDPTDPKYIYAGSQDQGHQRSALGATAGPVNFEQVISGDYGEYSFSENGTHLWTVYPFGSIQYRPTPKTGGNLTDFEILGDDQPAGGWIYPTAEVANPSQNKIYVAGGNMNGGSGSYLITLTANANDNVTSTQGNYNFYSQSGGNAISAIAASTISMNRVYVATENGRFFYSTTGGSSWTQNSNTGTTDYINAILPSKLNNSTVWMCGNGYDSPGVFKSTNNGQTFNGMGNGLPDTQIRGIAANADESLLFAATDAGPYVYVAIENQWYSLLGAATPVQSYRSVEYLTDSETARFGTYGRGIWDFALETELPLEWLAFDAKVQASNQARLSWSTANERNADHFEIERGKDGSRFEKVGQLAAKGDGTYQWLDVLALEGISYYRIRQVDLDGSATYSIVRSVKIDQPTAIAWISPNPFANGRFTAHFREGGQGGNTVTVYDAQGRLLAKKVSEDGAIGRLDIELLDLAHKGIVLVEMMCNGQRSVFKALSQ